jgi:hypothetical protein
MGLKDSGTLKRVQALWDTYCREHKISFTSYNKPDSQLNSSNKFEQLRKDLQQERNQRPRSPDEFKNYCAEQPSYGINIPAVEWWLQDSQKERYPQLSLWAIEVLSIPSMSDKPERVFSGCRRTVPWDKTALSAEMLEQLECGRDWKKDSLLIDNF